MTSDELKGLRLRRAMLAAELERIDNVLKTEGAFEGKTYKDIQPPNQRTILDNDFRNAGANGNYE